MASRGIVAIKFDGETHMCFQSHDAFLCGEDVLDFIISIHTNPLNNMLFTEGLKKVEWVAMGSSKDIVTNLQIDPIDSFWLLIKHGLLILPEVVKYKFGKYIVSWNILTSLILTTRALGYTDLWATEKHILLIS